MSYCVNCGGELADNVNFCPYCGTAVNGGCTAGGYTASGASTSNSTSNDAVKTAATVAGVAVGASWLSRLMRRHRRPLMHHHMGMPGGMFMGPRPRGHHRPPMGGHMGGPMRGPGGRGPMGGPGGRGPGGPGGRR